MKQAQKDINKQLLRFASPIGPLGSFDEMLAAKQSWHDSLNAEALPYLMEILAMTSLSEEFSNLEIDDLLGETSEALDALAEREGELVARTICACLSDSPNKSYLIEALGATDQVWTITDCLEPLLNTDLTVEETIAVVGTLGDLGGKQAQELLAKIEAKLGENEKIQSEILIARGPSGSDK